MPEPIDPIRELENFGTGGGNMTPQAPTEVRRLGDRRRARQRNAIMAVAAAVVAVAVPVALIAAPGERNGTPPIMGTPTPTPTATPAVITFPGSGIDVSSAADTAALEGTTEEFKTFIADQARKDADQEQGCPDPKVTVQKYSSAGYALGGVGGCGGYVALWVLRDGQWQEGSGTQDAWDCDALAYLGVPASFAGECANEAGGFGPEEVDGLRLGMTQAQIEAAGGTLDPGPQDQCRGLLLPYQSPVRDHVDGYLSPTQGLVAVFARPGMKTPERIGLGSSRAAVESAYPNATQKVDYWVVPVAHGVEYQIGFAEDGTVDELALAMPAQECYN